MYQLRRAVALGVCEDIPNMVFDSFAEAMDLCAKLYQTGKDEILSVHDTVKGMKYRIQPYKLAREACPVCGNHVRAIVMKRIHNEFGAPNGVACPDCYRKILDERGFD